MQKELCAVIAQAAVALPPRAYSRLFNEMYIKRELFPDSVKSAAEEEEEWSGTEWISMHF